MDLPPFLFLMLFLTPQLANSSLHNNFTDLSSLLAFKSHVSDPLSILSGNWTPNTSFCNWLGVGCSVRRQRVTSLNLSSITLQGAISPRIANLSFLSALDLGNTSLTGSIPEALSRLPRLKKLVLQRNSLSGSVPPEFFNMSSLTGIFLSANNLSGSLPSNYSISTCPRLRTVFIGYNQLTGEIPSSFARCRNLQRLSFLTNKLDGIVPGELGHLQELTLLDFSDNKLTGKIPFSLGNLTKLEVLSISRNNLEGEIPKEIGYLSNLDTLLLYTNRLTGSIPIELLNASMIQLIELSSNHLTGPVPDTIGNSMPLLNRLNFANNSLTGGLNFVASLSNCRNLQYVGLQLNELEGSIPRSVGNLSGNLQQFIVAGNNIKGSIPSGFANFSSLVLLNLGNNQLTGSIPSELTRLTSLRKLNLRFNRIDGVIPSELGLMNNLNILSFEANQIFGMIPDSIGNITGLQLLFLDGNRLSSEIPLSMWSLSGLIELHLSQNSLHGFISPQISNLDGLVTLDLSENQFSGNISNAIGDLQMLTYLDLSNNSIDGEIPQSLGRLISIKYLNLSRNFLSGVIPKSLANLRYLGSLDLSFNMLEGQIPQGRVFSNHNIASLKGNLALCGAPQLGFTPCTSHSSRKLNFLKYVLPIIAVLIVLSCTFLIFTFHRRKKMRNLSNSQRLGDHRVISYHDLIRATNNFSEDNLLGRGNFSSVYKGFLDDGSIIAVKVLNLEVEGASKSFEAECQALSRVRHRNLIKIISVCFSLDYKALILQYMPNGSLDQWLHSENYYLNLLQRLNIMVDVSSALEYLHHHHPQVILHCDLKPSNILLDEEMVAHVSDFGIARLLIGDTRSMASASTPGTIGYIAPEYGSTGTVSRMGDVYSFGIILLETFTGRKPVDAIFKESSLREFVHKAFPVSMLGIVDDNLFRDGPLHAEQQFESQTSTYQCISSIVELGLLCSSYSPKERIPMTDVVPRLKKIRAEYMSHLSVAARAMAPSPDASPSLVFG